MFLLFERIPHKNSSIFFLFRSFERSELQAHMATVFWDSQGIILIVYLEKGTTITDLFSKKFFSIRIAHQLTYLQL